MTATGPGGHEAMGLQCRDTLRTPHPLLEALESVRHRMTRQTMRFLGNASKRPSEAIVPAAPPAEGEGWARNQQPPARSSRRRRAYRSAGRVGRGCWGRCAGGRGHRVCCIRVHSPSVRVFLQHGDQEEPRPVAHIRPRAKKPMTVRQVTAEVASAATPEETPRSAEAHHRSQGEPMRSLSGAGPQPPSGGEANAVLQTFAPASPVPRVHAGLARRKPRPGTPPGEHSPGRLALGNRASSESLESYVRRKASTILHQVARSICWFEGQCGGAQPSGSRERLLQQVSRVAAYTAASRHVQHAANLYVVASITSRRARRGWVRYCKLDCPRQPGQLVTDLHGHLPLTVPSRLVSPLAAKPSGKAVGNIPCDNPIHVNDLPKDILLKILSKLDQRELSLHVAPVCRAWHRLARSRQFWRELTFDAAFHQYSAQSLCNLLRATPGLWTLELVACRDIDLVLDQVSKSCHKLRTLVVDSCAVSQQLQCQRQKPEVTGQTGQGLPLTPDAVLDAVLEQCTCLQYLIVAFTPFLCSSTFFRLLGRRCWSLQCFLVSADDCDVRAFCESLSEEAVDKTCSGASKALLGSLTALTRSWTRNVPPPACRASTASDNCHAAHPPRETNGLKRRVTAVRTRNRLLRMLALRPDAELRLLQWRLADQHATLDYFGVEAHLCFQ